MAYPIPTALTIVVETTDANGKAWSAEFVDQETGVVLSRCRTPDGQIELGLLPHLQSDGWTILAVSIAVIVTAHLTLLLCLRCCKQHKLSVLPGVVSGLQTQPAVLSFAATKAPSGPLNTAYAAAYRLAVILKIILGQVLVALA